KVHGSLARAGK
nr:RecName: Full=Small ribosomal subunit protein eS30; AltName: Full=40S ribosomal protein S30 [Oncorhynchus mykiss]